jgi:hypothetical protein
MGNWMLKKEKRTFSKSEIQVQAKNIGLSV